MSNIQAFFKSCSAWLREDLWPGYEIDFFRQGTPPDEDYASAQEELAESVSYANRRAEVQAWELNSQLESNSAGHQYPNY